MINLPTCPACGSPASDAREIIRKDVCHGDGPPLSTRVVKCGCGHAFINPQPTSEELLPFYEMDYHVFADQVPNTATVDRLLARKHRGDRLNHARVVSGGRYLDVGCGLGEMVAGMARLGMEAEGVEPSRAAVDRVQSIGLKIHLGTLHDAQFPDSRFDSISLYHVLEHTTNPVAVLAECRRILSPRGEIVVGVPNFGSLVRKLVGSTWSAYDLPRHLHHFCQSSLNCVAARAGLSVTAMETESLTEHVEGELATWLSAGLRSPPASRSRQARHTRLLRIWRTRETRRDAASRSSSTCSPTPGQSRRPAWQFLADRCKRKPPQLGQGDDARELRGERQVAVRASIG